MTEAVTPAVLAGAVEAVRAHLRMGAGEETVVRDAVAAACGGARAFLGAELAAVWADLPGPVRQGIVLWSARLLGPGEAAAGPPAAATALLRPFRAVRLRPETAA